jgi:hypothetical protein
MDNAGNDPSGFADADGTSWKIAAVEVKSAKMSIIANAICFISCQLLLCFDSLNYFAKSASSKRIFPKIWH